MTESRTSWRGWRAGRRLLGAALVLLGLLPGLVFLDPSTVGPFGEWVVALEAESLELALWGSVLALGVGFLCAAVFGDGILRRILHRMGGALCAVPATPLVLGLGALATLLARGLSELLSGGLPTYGDSLAQLLQARFLADGMLAGPLPEPRVSQTILNTLMTENGWVSLYPPGHTLFLAAGLATGAVAWVGPVLTGVTVAAAARLLLDLLPHRPGTARLAALLTALSPFVLFIGGGYLSHTSCAAGIALAAFFGHRAGNGSWIWAMATGAAVGLAIASRPWTGLATLGVLVPTLWLTGIRERRNPIRWLSARAGGAALGGAPFAALLLAYDARHFGNPFRLAYEVAYGPAHGLGLHRDPWGYPYGWVEALGYTASDLSALGIHLLETPLPLAALVGAFLLVARHLPRGTGPLLAWALTPVAANFFYWHHGFHLGPRMLYEAAPAWVGLTALSATWIIGPMPRKDEASPAEGETVGGRPERNGSLFAGIRPATVFLWTLTLGLAGPLFLVPARIEANTWSEETRARMSPPTPEPGNALIFVHGSWSERVSARLQASGMRFDSLEVAMRRNDLCLLDRYARARLAGEALPDLDFTPRPGAPPELTRVEVPGGGRIQIDPTTDMSAVCRQELHADRRGTVPLAPLLWRGDLRGLENGRPAYVRDLGPEDNETIISAWPGRTVWFLVPEGPGLATRLVSYSDGIEVYWSNGGPEAPD